MKLRGSKSVFRVLFTFNEYAMVVSKLKSLEFVILSSFEPVFIPYLKLTRHPNPTSYLPTIFWIAILPPVTPSCLKAFLFVMFFPSFISLFMTYLPSLSYHHPTHVSSSIDDLRTLFLFKSFPCRLIICV